VSTGKPKSGDQGFQHAIYLRLSSIRFVET